MHNIQKYTSILLNNGLYMPLVGLGLFQGYNSEGKVKSYGNNQELNHEVKKQCMSALSLGYRHFDTAWHYNTEEGLGLALKDSFQSGQIKRGEVFITTKLWCTSHRRDEVVPALERSLEKLQLDYADNYVVHHPVAMPPSEEFFPKDSHGNTIFEDNITSLTDTWQGMEECLQRGLTKTIGISNFNKRQILKIVENGGTVPSNLQVESHPFFSNKSLASLCRELGIVMVAYSPLGKPHRPWVASNDPVVFTNNVLIDLGKKYNKTAAQIALRFQTQRGIAVVPKSANPQRQEENLNTFDFTLSEEDVSIIFEKCDKYQRVQPLDHIAGSKEYPFSDEDIK